MKATPLIFFIISAIWATPSFAFGGGKPKLALHNPGASPGSSPGPSIDQVELLVSLDPKFYPKGVAGWLHDYSQYPAKLEKTFRDAFSDSGFAVDVVQNATIFDLYQALHSSQNVAVYWVSHEAPVSLKKVAGVGIDPLLVDKDAADVKDAFREIDPAIRWVSLVACDSEQIVNWLTTEDQPEVKSFTDIQGFDKEIDANKGLQYSLQKSQTVLNSSARVSPTCPSRDGLEVVAQRKMSGADGSLFPAMAIEQNGLIIGVFPEESLAAGDEKTDTQTVDLSAPASGTFSASDLQLVMQSGLDPLMVSSGMAFGAFSIQSSAQDAQNAQDTQGTKIGGWKVFAKPDGTPFGVTEQLLTYEGSPPDAGQLASFAPVACQLQFQN